MKLLGSNTKKTFNLVLTILICVSCGNPELENKQRLLDIAIADKNHYEILKNARDVLEIDPENIMAISALRDSARIYLHIKSSAENLKRIDEKGFDDSSLKFSMETPNDDPELLRYLIEFFNNQNISSELKTDAERIKTMNEWFAGYQAEESPDTVTDILKAKIILIEIAEKYESFIDQFKDQVDILVEAKKSLEKAERLDPRFRGIIELEETIEERAKIFAGYAHIYFTFQFTDRATEAAGYYDQIKAATDKKWDQYIDLNMTKYGYGIAEAYQFGKLEIDSKDWTKHITFKIYQRNAQKLLSLYKDLDDEFDDIDSLDSAISTLEYMIKIFKNTEASGTLSEWSSAMSESVTGYISSLEELTNELDELDDLSEKKIELNKSLDMILDEDLIRIAENSDYI